jgi:ribosomal protein S18 acetylase RimI-like enzyme
VNIRLFQLADKQDVIALWAACGLVMPWNDPENDIERKLAVGADLFLVGEREGKLVAVAMGGYEGHRGWVNYLAVEDDLRGMGYARQMMDELEVRLLTKGCPKINLQVRGSNLDVQRFYEALGYKKDACISMGKRLISD